LKGCDIEVKLHPGKENTMTYALSRKSIGSVAFLLTQERRLIRELNALQIKIMLSGNRSYLAALHITSPLVE